MTENEVQKYGNNPRAKLEANELSLLLALAVNDGCVRFNVLLCADGGIASMNRGLVVWRDFAAQRSISDRFDAIKVAHHGSIKNHVPELCKLGSEDRESRFAAVSAGERDALPDRAVITDFLETGWTVMSTTVRMRHRVDRVADLHFKREVELRFDRNTIEISWNRDGTSTFQPKRTVVSADQLPSYSTAQT